MMLISVILLIPAFASSFLQNQVSFSSKHIPLYRKPFRHFNPRDEIFNHSGGRHQRSKFTLLASRNDRVKTLRLKQSKNKNGASSKSIEDAKMRKDEFCSEPSIVSKSNTIYSLPALYDLAFGYRNYEEEVKFLMNTHRKYSQNSSLERKSVRILELAAGPARHSLTALSNYSLSEVERVVALDISHEMVNYGIENADHELGAIGGRRNDFAYVCGDMRNIEKSITDKLSKLELFDTVWLLLGSMQHLLTNDDIIKCFCSINSLLRPGGTIVLELPHPQEIFSMGECTKNEWSMPLVHEIDDSGRGEEYGDLNIIWGEDDDLFDAVAQIRHFTVSMELVIRNPNQAPNSSKLKSLTQLSGNKNINLKEIVPMRLFTLHEIDALARCAGFDLVAKYGALMDEISIENIEEAFRMVCVLRKAA